MKKELSYLETVKMIADIKKHFEGQLEARLGIIKVPSPIFLKTSSGLQDQCFLKFKKTLPINITLCYYENMKGMYDNRTTDLKTTKYVSFEIDGTRYYKIII